MSLNNEAIRDYNVFRNLSVKSDTPACYAPFVNLAFSTDGNVSACGRNQSYVYGNINEMSLAQIWGGGRIRSMREKLGAYELPASCGLCRVEIESRSFQGSGPLAYDLFPVEGIAPQWPQQMEFFLTNLCKFQCIMCKGSLFNYPEKTGPTSSPPQGIRGPFF